MKKKLIPLSLSAFLLFSAVPSVEATGQNLTRCQVDGLYGYTDEREELVIPALYQEANPFVDGLALVSRDADLDGFPYEYGFIDATGEEVIPVQYKSLTPFSEGMTLAQYNGKFGYLNTEGAVVIDFVYDEASPFEDGQAVVKENGQVSIIQNPNYVNSNLTIRQEDFAKLSTPEEFISYLRSALASFQDKDLNQASLKDLEQLLTAMMTRIPAVEGIVEGDTIYIKGNNYHEVADQGAILHISLSSLLSKYTLNQEIDLALLRIQAGLGNLSDQGTPVMLEANTVYHIDAFPVPYFNPDLYHAFTDTDEFMVYFNSQLNEMNGSNPNTSGITALGKYLDTLFANRDPLHFSARLNKISLDGNKYQSYFKEGQSLTTSIQTALSAHNIQLHRDFTNDSLLLVDSINLENTVTLVLNSGDILPYLDGTNGLRIVMGSSGEGVYLPSDTLEVALSTENQVELQLDFTQDSVSLLWMDSSGKEPLADLPGAIFLTLPCTDTTATVMAGLGLPSHNGTMPTTSQVWGGQIRSNQTIQFATRYSGFYQISTEKPILLDVDGLSDDQQMNILTMAINDFLFLEQGNFRPGNSLTRAEFVSALVKMNFAQDETATSTFSDLSSDDPFYALISAAVQSGIVDGYQDNTFRGDNLTTRGEVVSFMASILVETQGYQYPQYPEQVLATFSDVDTIPDWAKPAVALAVDHQLIAAGGAFRATDEITRLEATTWLCSLYEVLHHTATPTKEAMAEISANTWMVALLCTLISGGLLLIIGLLTLIRSLRTTPAPRRRTPKRMEQDGKRRRPSSRTPRPNYNEMDGLDQFGEFDRFSEDDY